MKKLIVYASVLVSLFAASSVSAQTYYPYSGTAYSPTCSTLTRDLTVGSRGSDVSSLQSFLVARNYPGGGSWMVTGYYGQATRAAVQIFQRERGLTQTGVVDAITRSAICGTNTNVFNVNPVYSNPTYPTYPTYPSYPTYPTYPTYPNTTTGIVTISSLSESIAAQGSPITIYGTNLDYSNNTVYVGSLPVTSIASYNGTSLTFTVPASLTGDVLVYVANSRGSSNSLKLNVIPYSYPCSGTYSYSGNCSTCTLPYTNCQSGMPTIQYLSPTSGAVGATVTIYGSGFTTTGNTVRFGPGIITNINSGDGRALSFIVPSQVTGYGSQSIALATYNISVTNSAGLTSNAIPFTVTSLGSIGAPTISSVSGPSNLNSGTQGTWTLQVNNPQASYSNYITLAVRWGDESAYGAQISPVQTSYAQGSQTFTFTHSYLQPGTYAAVFTVTNASGQTNTSTATVTVSGSATNSLSLLSVSPISGRVGSQIILTGTGFNALENAVLFGTGGTQHLPSIGGNGTTLYFTIPQYTSPCDVVLAGQVCAQYFQQVTPGTYQVSVRNSFGTSNPLTFTVTQ